MWIAYVSFVVVFLGVKGVGVVFVFKQNTAYEMRISDWSSDVCSSDLRKDALFQDFYRENRLLADTVRAQIAGGRAQPADAVTPKQEAAQLEEQQDDQIGRASCRERVCKYV